MSLKTFCGGRKIFLILAVLFLNLFVVSPALAASTNYVPLVNIPGVNPNAGVLTYLSGLYNFLISVVGILAMAVIIYGGMRYLTSAGNPSSVEEAKDAITSAITGLILALVSWLILSTINPDILVLKSVGVSGGGTYGYGGIKNVCVANSTGDGTAANPCVCADGATVYAKGGAVLTPTLLTMAISPNPATTTPPGNKVTISGKLTDTSGNGVPGTIKINMINTTLNASSTFPPITTAADGSYSYTDFTPTCVATNQMQAVYTGDATHSGSASSPITFVINGLTICTAANYTFSPANVSIVPAGGGSPCQAICSDQTLASDNAYHCLKADVRIGWAPKNEWKHNTDAQNRAIATNSGTDAAPFIATQGQWYIVNMVDYSNPGVNLPVKYYFDTNFDGLCDPASDTELVSDSGQKGWSEVYADIKLPLVPICQAAVAPIRGIICGQKFCIQDSKGNRADTTLYYTILDDPTVSPNISPGP